MVSIDDVWYQISSISKNCSTNIINIGKYSQYRQYRYQNYRQTYSHQKYLRTYDIDNFCKHISINRHLIKPRYTCLTPSQTHLTKGLFLNDGNHLELAASYHLFFIIRVFYLQDKVNYGTRFHEGI